MYVTILAFVGAWWIGCQLGELIARAYHWHQRRRRRRNTLVVDEWLSRVRRRG